MIAAVGLGLMGVHIRISLNDYTVVKWTKGYLLKTKWKNTCCALAKPLVQ